MRIVDRDTFLEMPKGTLFSKYSFPIFEELQIKDETCYGSDGEAFDYRYQDIADSVMAQCSSERTDLLREAEAEGVNVEMDFYVISRDGLFDQDQMFAVWDESDVQALFECLARYGHAAKELGDGSITGV